MKKKVICFITIIVFIILLNTTVLASNMLSTINPRNCQRYITLKEDYYYYNNELDENDNQYNYFIGQGFSMKERWLKSSNTGGLVSSYNTAGMKDLLITHCKANDYGFSNANVFEQSTTIYGVIGSTIETYQEEDKYCWPSIGGTDIYSRNYIFMWREGAEVYVGCTTLWNNQYGIWHVAEGVIYGKTLKSSSTGHCSWYEPTNSTNQYKADVEQIAKKSAKAKETINNIKISGNWSINGDFTKGNKKVICEVKKNDSKTYKRIIILEWDNTYDLIWYTQNENDVLYKDENGNEVQSEEEAEAEAQENANQTKTKIYSRLLSLADEGSERAQTTFTDVLSNPDSYKPAEITESDTSDAFAVGRTILGAINIIGIVASVIIIAALGIKYILGSIEEKAEFKEGLVPYVVGIILLIGVPTIVNILYNFGVRFYVSG